MENKPKVELVYGKLTVDSVQASQYQKKGTLTAQLRQEVTVKTTYPAQVIGDNFSDNLFDEDDFEQSEGTTYTNKETRIAWIPVPETIKGRRTTKKDIEKLLAENPEACIYKVMSNHPILTDGQQIAINKGLKTKEDFADSQICRYGENSDEAGELILDKKTGKVQYRKCFFSKEAKDDIDLRNANPSDYFASDEVEAELEAIREQSIF